MMFYNFRLTSRNIKMAAVIIIVLALLWFALSYQILQGVFSPTKDRVIYRIDTDKNVISLTFDVVWTDEYTGDLLKTLERYDIKSTFFVTGKWMEKYPELTEEILKQGHEIGNHTYSHAHLKELEEEKIRDEIIKVDTYLSEKFDYHPKFFRPPFGEYDERVIDIAEELGYFTVLWSIETGDWLNPGVDKVIDRVVKRTHRGGIILLHNCSPQGVKALPVIIHALKMRNYKIVPVSELLGLTQSNNNEL
ncbi:MAG: hypothetical protein CVU88_03245 [Firmicutes bacterium HGW-Firmicutes-13]|nr:MAG: hypothetical protein CVU88_03245 [Firmicutes bacterium HGW-Firmicutes-13]